MRTIPRILSTFALIACSAQALALPVTLQSVMGEWSNVTGGTQVTYYNRDSVGGNEEVRWGTPTQRRGLQSGYRFDGAAPFTAQTDELFSLGTFSHFNYQMRSGTSISGAQLTITTNLLVDGLPVSDAPFEFSFIHRETNNECEPQPTCANDIIRFDPLSYMDTVSLNGRDYTLRLLGFQYGSNPVTGVLSSPEYATNTAQLMATLSVSSSVPEPSALLLWGVGLLGLGVSRRRLSA